jgi:hypothetical protein
MLAVAVAVAVCSAAMVDRGELAVVQALTLSALI